MSKFLTYSLIGVGVVGAYMLYRARRGSVAGSSIAQTGITQTGIAQTVANVQAVQTQAALPPLSAAAAARQQLATDPPPGMGQQAPYAPMPAGSPSRFEIPYWQQCPPGYDSLGMGSTRQVTLCGKSRW